MKLRILNNSIRLRLTQAEIKQFQEEGKVKGQTQFGSIDTTHLIYSVEQADVSEIQANFDNNIIRVLLPKELGINWAASNEVSLEHFFPINQHTSLRILVEKDFKCLKEREGEDESDMFPHPNLE
jgi:hypothetical protein